jgi:hypothetical protein
MAEKKAVNHKKAEQAKAVKSRLEPAILAQLTKAELSSLKDILRVLRDTNMALKALNAMYNSKLVEIRTKYDLPEDFTIDDETGVVKRPIDG